ncbi:MAG: type II toxin-antitoxin system MqsR family toxin [Bacilli bacterium]|nr:type II toxin-antitoxin system MqsR family toxin [Bacilli bacterium]
MEPDKITIDELITLIGELKQEQFDFVNRDKNIDFLEKHNLSIENEIEAIKQLNKHDLKEGSVEDDNPNRKHPVWIFIKKIWNIECYIKIKVINHCRVIIVISFHETESKGGNKI